MVWTRDELATLPDSGTREWDTFMVEQYQRLARRAESEGDMYARDVWTAAINQVSDTFVARKPKGR